jgi:hypothetical protein
MGRQHFDVNYYFVYCRQKPTFYQFMILQSVLPVYFAINFEKIQNDPNVDIRGLGEGDS